MFGTIAKNGEKTAMQKKHTLVTAGMRNTCEQADAKMYKTLQTD